MSGGAGTSGSSNSSTPDLYGIKKIVLPQKEYEEELREEETAAPGLLYDYSSMTAWLYHPVKRMKVTNDSSHHSGGDKATDSSDCANSSGKLNGNYGV